MEEEYYEDYEDQIDDQEFADVPSQKKKDDLFTLFKKVWKAPDSSKVGNLSNPELGALNITVRDSQRIATLADTFHQSGLEPFLSS